MTRITRRAALGLLAAPALTGAASAQATRLRFAHPHPESDSWHRAALRFAELLRERSEP